MKAVPQQSTWGKKAGEMVATTFKKSLQTSNRECWLIFPQSFMGGWSGSKFPLIPPTDKGKAFWGSCLSTGLSTTSPGIY